MASRCARTSSQKASTLPSWSSTWPHSPLPVSYTPVTTRHSSPGKVGEGEGKRKGTLKAVGGVFTGGEAGVLVEGGDEAGELGGQLRRRPPLRLHQTQAQWTVPRHRQPAFTRLNSRFIFHAKEWCKEDL